MNASVKVWEKLAQAAQYRSSELAKLLKLSPQQLRYRARRLIGRSPQDWLNEKQILEAQRRLAAGQPIKRIAYDLGFKQLSHFCRRFRKYTKMTASEFTNHHAGGSLNFRRYQSRSLRRITHFR